MRQFISLISFVILTSFLVACTNNKVKTINISKINTPCDCIDAFDLLTGEMLLLLEERNKLRDMDIPEYTNENEDIMDERYLKIYDERDNLREQLSILAKPCNEFNEFMEFLDQTDYGKNTLPDCKNSANLFTKMEKIKYMGFWNKSFFN